MKDLLKSDAGGAGNSVGGTNGLTVLSRTVPSAVITHYMAKIAGLETKIVQCIQEESFKTQTDSAMREVERAENLLLHEVGLPSFPLSSFSRS